MSNNTAKQSRLYSHLCIEEREEIAISIAKNQSLAEIAAKIGRHKSTVSRELRRNSPSVNKVRYRANRAQMRSEERKKDCRKRESLKSESIRNYAEKNLKKGWSPEQIAGRLPIDRPELKTNYESVYQWVYADRPDLIPYLPWSHRVRRKRGSGKYKHRSKIPNRTPIADRPQKASNRQEKGHWEADTIVSRASKAAVAVIQERTIRYCKLKKLARKSAKNMVRAIVSSFRKIPAFLHKSITYDNGTENAMHETINGALGTTSYFCQPYHSWEKGSVENQIGLVRRFFPKGTDWSKVTQKDLDRVEKLLNNRPRKCLGYKTPRELFVALTL
jgi:transposase, IS30 family